MSKDDSIDSLIKAAEARLLLKARAEIERETAADMAELHRLAAKYNLRVVSADNVEPEPPLAAREPEAKPAPQLQPRPHDGNGHAKPTHGIETLRDLASRYRTDKRSAYRELRFTVRSTTDNWLDRIVKEHGDIRLENLNADLIKKIYDLWSADGAKLATGHAFVTKLRGLFSFGTTILDDPGCQRLSTIMNRMRFPMPQVRTERLTENQVVAIRDKAHEMGKPSIALAQAIQFQLGLSQKDVIGEYVPATEPGASEIIVDGNKWLYGIRWEEIDQNLVLQHVTSFNSKSVELDLKRAPMVLQELERLGSMPKKGPIIVSEWSGKPWAAAEFRRWWRKVADEAGVPKTVKNMDSSRAADRVSNPAEPASPDAELALDVDKEIRLH